MSTTGQSVTAYAPASVANLGPGFDALGLAIRGLGDTVQARRGGRGVRLLSIQGDGGALPLDAHRNTAGIAARATLRAMGQDPDETGVELTLRKGMPIGSGLGSSAASAAAAAYATNALMGSPLRRESLIGPCVEAEAAVAGRHADNVAPAILGGLVLIRSVDPLDVIRLPTPTGLRMVIATPAFELNTKVARDALPGEVPLAAMVSNAAHLATFVAACYANDPELLSRAMREVVVTPARARLIPGAAQVMEGARLAGALGTSICGAGPSIFGICHSTVVANAVEAAMVAAFAGAGLRATTLVTPIDCPGVMTT